MARRPKASGTGGVVDENAGSIVVCRPGVADERLPGASEFEVIQMAVDVLVVAPTPPFNKGCLARGRMDQPSLKCAFSVARLGRFSDRSERIHERCGQGIPSSGSAQWHPRLSSFLYCW